MRFAICFSGQCREPFEHYDNISQNIVQALERFGDVDIFCHFWKGETKFERGDLPDLNNKDTLSSIIDLYGPKSFSIEDQIDFSNCRPHVSFGPQMSAHKIGSMFYSIYQSNLLKKIYEVESDIVYDKVLRMRTDRLFHHELNDESIFVKNRISARTFSDNGINDQFAIGDSRLMDLYSDCYNFIRYSKTCGPERLLGEWFRECSVLKKSFLELPASLHWY